MAADTHYYLPAHIAHRNCSSRPDTKEGTNKQFIVESDRISFSFSVPKMLFLWFRSLSFSAENDFAFSFSVETQNENTEIH